MNFARAVDRVQADFVEMPDLELTIPQAARLWNLGADDCRAVLNALTDAGFLKWTARRTVIRIGRPLAVPFESQPSHVPVSRQASRRDPLTD